MFQAAVEALHALYSRSGVDIEDIQPLVLSMYQTDHVLLLQKLYQWSDVGPDDTDDTKYQILKKLSEVGDDVTKSSRSRLIFPIVGVLRCRLSRRARVRIGHRI